MMRSPWRCSGNFIAALKLQGPDCSSEQIRGTADCTRALLAAFGTDRASCTPGHRRARTCLFLFGDRVASLADSVVLCFGTESVLVSDVRSVVGVACACLLLQARVSTVYSVVDCLTSCHTGGARCRAIQTDHRALSRLARSKSTREQSAVLLCVRHHRQTAAATIARAAAVPWTRRGQNSARLCSRLPHRAFSTLLHRSLMAWCPDGPS